MNSVSFFSPEPTPLNSSTRDQRFFLGDFERALQSANVDIWNRLMKRWSVQVIQKLDVPLTIKELFENHCDPQYMESFVQYCEEHMAEIQGSLRETKPPAAKKLFKREVDCE